LDDEEREKATAYFKRGNAHDENDNYDAAITDYTEAIRLDPVYARAYHNRGFAHQQLGNRVQADADHQKARELGYEP
jgi:Flp pilus assembly protein TadD